MAKAVQELAFKQIENALEQMPSSDLQKISRRVWALEMERLAAKMRKSAKKNKVTQKDIDRMCEEARKKVYEKYRS